MPTFFDNRIGLWAHFTPRVLGHLHEIRDLGFDYLVVKIADRTSAYHAGSLHQLTLDAASIGFPLVAWAYVYPDNIDAQIAALQNNIPPGVTDLILDAEVEWEHDLQAAATAEALCHGFAEATNHQVAMHLSGFYASDFHPQFPYDAFLAHCASWMPQAYQFAGTSVATVMDRVNNQAVPLAQKSLEQALVVTVNTPDMLTAAAGGFNALNVWLWDGDGQDLGVDGRQQLWSDTIAAVKNPPNP